MAGASYGGGLVHVGSAGKHIHKLAEQAGISTAAAAVTPGLALNSVTVVPSKAINRRRRAACSRARGGQGRGHSLLEHALEANGSRSSKLAVRTVSAGPTSPAHLDGRVQQRAQAHGSKGEQDDGDLSLHMQRLQSYLSTLQAPEAAAHRLAALAACVTCSAASRAASQSCTPSCPSCTPDCRNPLPTHRGPRHNQQHHEQQAGGEDHGDAAPGGQRDAVWSVQRRIPASAGSIRKEESMSVP